MTGGPPPFALRDYALLADGERGVLIGPRGEMTWMCFPTWDSPSVFSALLGGDGHYQVTPDDDRFVWGGYYDEGSLIWNSRWVTTDAVIECREALAFPTHPSRACILRRVKAVRGRAHVIVRLSPAADYGRRPMSGVTREGGVWSATTGPVHLRWQAGAGVRRDRNGGLTLRLDLAEGETHDLVLRLSTTSGEDDELRSAKELWTTTEEMWHHAVPPMEGLPAQRDAAHAYAIMRGLTTATGAMVAAATMALPERAEAGRNYDYRYAWIRDQSFAGQAAAVVSGAEFLLDAAVRFVAGRLHADGTDLRPAYRTSGDVVPDETDLPHLRGYPGGEVRAGNRANQQFQLDALGESLLLLAAAARADRVDHEHWKAAEIAVEAVAARWEQPDAGIWELEDRWWTHSRLTCVAGLRHIATCTGGAQAGRWTALADAIAAETARTCVHPGGRWQRAPDDARVDAALLLPVLRRAVSGDDPRTTATMAVIEDELCQDGYIYRYRHDDRPLQDAEGAFSLCGFALALAYHELGQPERAIAWFERNRASCGPPGLLTEEFDVGERQLRGNIPQAFVHALLLECAARLGER
ncbi:MAG TPA: glycoside hydrolase family 15 protein [Acidimicrobiales bacterium]|nr:glycoside hydrolase family 15 protein [Acidimicrobiales bacterium]